MRVGFFHVEISFLNRFMRHQQISIQRKLNFKINKE